jgi:hypothetical protein
MIERTECGIFDAEDDKQRMDQVKKKVRTVYANRPITMTLQIRNPLALAIKLNSVRLVCAYVEDLEKIENIETKEDFADFDVTPV